MKNKQKAVSKIHTLILILCTVLNATGQTPEVQVEKADSLFASKQYTQSLELYQQILSQHNYSKSMLLKMAYIQEGLGHLSESLYYLNLYYIASSDKQALSKMEDMATKNHLVGYQSGQSRQFRSLVRENYNSISEILVGFSILFFAILIYQKKRKKNPLPMAICIVMLLSILFFHTNSSRKMGIAIVHNDATYLMSGPSAGSSVVGIINEGHLLDVLGKEDVWIQVEWMNQDVYLKEDQVLKIEL